MLRITDAKKSGAECVQFSWKLEGNEKQRFYQIRVRDRKHHLVWDSGKREDARRHNIACETVLKPDAVYDWEVEVWGGREANETCRGDSFLSCHEEWTGAWAEPDRTRKPMKDSMPSVQMSGRSVFEVVTETGYIVATLIYAMTTELMCRVCTVLGEDSLAEHYRDLNRKIREAFAKEYVKEDGTLTKEYQRVYVLALRTDCIPGELRTRAVDRLCDLIHENNDLLDTGFLSVSYLLPVLEANGRKDLATMLLFRDDCPSWLYEVKMGATTMWEYWNGYARDGTPMDCSMNHFAFGCVGQFLFENILGIRPEEPGFGRVRICPDLDCGLSFAEGSYESIWGRIAVKWGKEEGHVKIDLEIPPDVTAEVVIGADAWTCGGGNYHLETITKTA